MANPTILLGKTSDSSQLKLQTEILFHTVASFQARASQKPQFIPPHRHDFWQLELACGKIHLLHETGTAMLREGDTLLLPPGTLHGFSYPGQGETWLSIKFHLTGAHHLPEPRILPPSPFQTAWRRCVRTLFREPEPVCTEALSGLITAFLSTLWQPSKGGSARPEPVRRAISYINGTSGQPLTVSEVAKAAGVAGGYLAALFREATGHTVKEYIDLQRMERCRQMLRYADLPITRIAEQLGFPDLFAFSRYFKRHEKLSPRDFRFKALTQQRQEADRATPSYDDG